MSLYSMVYVSIANQEMTDNHLQALLNKARENNEKLSVTGMLLYRDGFFIQALEGEQEVVENLYNIISKDNRHENLIVIDEKLIEKRSFPDWTMGFNTINDDEMKTVKGYASYLKQSTPALFSQYASLIDMFFNRFRH